VKRVARGRRIRHDEPARSAVTTRLREVLLAAAVAAPVLGAGVGRANGQVPEVGPRGDVPAEAPPAETPAPAPAPEPVIITIGPDGRPIEQPEGDLDTSGLYHFDGGDAFGYEEPAVVHAGPVEELPRLVAECLEAAEIPRGVVNMVTGPGPVVGDEIAIREYLDLTLSIDHDIVDGAPAARFGQSLRELLESASGLAEFVEPGPLAGTTIM